MSSDRQLTLGRPPEGVVMETACDCAAAGWCPRHGFTTTEREWELCRTRADYFVFFASGRSPQHARELRRRARLGGEPEANPGPGPGLPVGNEEQLAEALPCRWRGERLEDRLCDLCGQRGTPFAVYGCSVHAECSLLRRHSRVQSCATCEDREATGDAGTQQEPLKHLLR